jgi:hypothetical protein
MATMRRPDDGVGGGRAWFPRIVRAESIPSWRLRDE